MSYDVESALITKIIEEDDVRSVVRQKVTREFFSDDSMGEIFFWIVEQFQKHGRVPSLSLLQREFPDYEPMDTDDDLMALVEEVKKEKLYADLAIVISAVTEETRDDPESGLEMLRQKTGELTLVHSSTDDMDVTKEIESMRSEYALLKSGEGLVGLPYPWKHLNDITLGMHPGELIGFYARPKSMKTWVSLYIANHLHETYGSVPAYFSCEMPLNQIRRRLAAMRAKLPYREFRRGQLTPQQEKAFYLALEELHDSPPFMLCGVDGTGGAAISDIRSRCEEYDVDLAVVDGAPFLMADEGWASFRTVTRGLKKGVAEPCKIPVLMTTQANRGAEKTRGQSTTEVAFGDSLAQDCDALVRMIRDPQHREARELLMTLPALREDEGGTWTIHTKPAGDFSQKHVFENEEGQDAMASTDEGGIMT